MDYAQRYEEVLSNVENARASSKQHQNVKIIAISKSVTASEIEQMHRIGQRAFGENRVQDMSEKAHTLGHLALEWHFVGRLQTNKINQLIDLNPSLIHSLSSLELALELDKRLVVKDKKLSALLQINSAYEAQKAGVEPEKTIEIYKEIQTRCQNIELQGVMSIGAHSEDVRLIQKSFETTYTLFEKLKPHGAKYCSMGMSGDYELAIRCGSNMLRLGSVLFH